jgi:hypothetical protein
MTCQNSPNHHFEHMPSGCGSNTQRRPLLFDEPSVSSDGSYEIIHVIIANKSLTWDSSQEGSRFECGLAIERPPRALFGPIPFPPRAWHALGPSHSSHELSDGPVIQRLAFIFDSSCVLKIREASSLRNISGIKNARVEPVPT